MLRDFSVFGISNGKVNGKSRVHPQGRRDVLRDVVTSSGTPCSHESPQDLRVPKVGQVF
jgi:hypothetical protein